MVDIYANQTSILSQGFINSEDQMVKRS